MLLGAAGPILAPAVRDQMEGIDLVMSAWILTGVGVGVGGASVRGPSNGPTRPRDLRVLGTRARRW